MYAPPKGEMRATPMVSLLQRTASALAPPARSRASSLPFIQLMRLLVDADGREWRVYERVGSIASPKAGQRSLIFDTDGMVRRLWHYPAGWDSLADDELLLLMQDLGSSGTAAAD